MNFFQNAKKSINDHNTIYNETFDYIRAFGVLLQDFAETNKGQELISLAKLTIKEDCRLFHITQDIENQKDYISQYLCFLFANGNYRKEEHHKLWAILMLGKFYYNGRKDTLYRFKSFMVEYAKELVNEILENESFYPQAYITYLKVKIGLLHDYI